MTQPAALTPSQPTPEEVEAALDQTVDLSTGLTRRDLQRAALAVCARSTDVDDARQLLEALGLLDQLRGTDRLAG